MQYPTHEQLAAYLDQSELRVPYTLPRLFPVLSVPSTIEVTRCTQSHTLSRVGQVGAVVSAVHGGI